MESGSQDYPPWLLVSFPDSSFYNWVESGGKTGPLIRIGPPEVEIGRNGESAGYTECLDGPSDIAELECFVTSNDAPEVTVTWTDPDDAILSGNSVITVSGDNTGTYKCIASHTDCGSDSDSVDIAGTILSL